MNRLLISVLLLGLALTLQAAPITYQGQLENSSGPYTGPVPMLFTLYADPEVGEPVAMFDAGSVNVVGGLFKVDLEFGGIFDGRVLWLEIEVDGSTLNQRQRIGAVPQAHHAATTPAYCQSGGPLIGMRDDGVPLCGLEGVVSISTSEEHACAALDDGSVWCWGSTSGGRLGNGESSSMEGGPYGGGVRVRVDDNGSDGGLLANVVQITTGRAFSCGRDEGGQVWCWGQNGRGQLGNGGIGTDQPRAVRARLSNGNSLDDAIHVDAGERHVCAVRDNGTLWCWGGNWYGQLGIGSNEDQSRAAQVIDGGGLPLTGMVGVSTGIDHSCAFDNDGHAWCWGYGSSGQLGNGKSGTDAGSFVATQVLAAEDQSLDRVTGIAAQADSTCALIEPGAEGRIYCWGSAGSGVLGNGETSGSRLFPVEVRIDDQGGDGGPLLGMRHIAQITLGSPSAQHLCAVRDEGSVWCWGRGSDGQLGDGETSQRTRAVQARVDRAGRDGGALSGISRVSVGRYQSCAHSDSGKAWCWGRNESGSLGLGWISYGRFPRAMPITRYVDPEG